MFNQMNMNGHKSELLYSSLRIISRQALASITLFCQDTHADQQMCDIPIREGKEFITTITMTLVLIIISIIFTIITM